MDIPVLLGVVLSGNGYFTMTRDKGAMPEETSIPLARVITSLPPPAPAGYMFPRLPYDPQRNLCAFLTSGSTGSPAAILNTHRSIGEDTARQIIQNEIDENDRIDLIFSLTFSASLACIFPASPLLPIRMYPWGCSS